MMLRMPEGKIAALFAECRVIAEFLNHALIQLGSTAGHALLKLRSPSNGAIDE
jgi:hypothetical protein